MATATAPRNDVYLSFLAGRALTALADLAAKPTTLSEQIRKELQSGIEFCQTIRTSRPDLCQVNSTGGHQALRRLATAQNAQEPSGQPTASDCDAVEQLLRDLLAQSHTPNEAEILEAINFFARDVGYLGS